MFLGCFPSVPTVRDPWLLPPPPLSARHSQEHHPAHEFRGAPRTCGAKQSQMEHLLVPDNTSGGSQQLPGGHGRHHWQQREDPHIHAFDPG